jgi:hypothetical protein
MGETNTKTQRRIVHLKCKNSNARTGVVGPLSLGGSKPRSALDARDNSKNEEGATPKHPARPKAD